MTKDEIIKRQNKMLEIKEARVKEEWEYDELGVEVKDKPYLEDGEYGNNPSPRGITPQNAYILYWATKFRIDEVDYPMYHLERFRLTDTRDILSRYIFLYDKGLIRPGTPREDIECLTIPELKVIAKKYGLKVGGRKCELISRILENVSDEQLDNEEIRSFWHYTEAGLEEKAWHRYLEFFFKNIYLAEIGITVNMLNQNQIDDPDTDFKNICLERIEEYGKEELKQYSNCKSGWCGYILSPGIKAEFLMNNGSYKEAIIEANRALFINDNVARFEKSCNDYDKYYAQEEWDYFKVDSYPIGLLRSIFEKSGMDEKDFFNLALEAYNNMEMKGKLTSELFLEQVKLEFYDDEDGLVSFFKKNFK